VRTPEQYLNALRDAREVYYRGERVADVVEHPEIGVHLRGRGLDQAEEVALDPLAREVVRHPERERLVREVESLRVREPCPVGRLVERAPQSLRNLGPQVLCCEQLLALHAG
jgi:hypothetical protein